MDRPEYHTARWQQLRARVIKRDGPRCASPPCTSDMTRPGMVFVDHITEMQEGEPFDWDPSHLQVLCKPHHDAKTKTAMATRAGEPVSPNA